MDQSRGHKLHIHHQDVWMFAREAACSRGAQLQKRQGAEVHAFLIYFKTPDGEVAAVLGCFNAQWRCCYRQQGVVLVSLFQVRRPPENSSRGTSPTKLV
mmetsp:Transcript_58134/g.136323  ORF Transcript_58134/g.136323 Transcript_58134/m.136323 type:complete len:99 (-) Transcript_58134:58-354(-)